MRGSLDGLRSWLARGGASGGWGYDWRRMGLVLVGLVLALVLVVWILERLDPNEVEVSGDSDAVVDTEVFDWVAESDRLDRLGVELTAGDRAIADDAVAGVATSGDTAFDVVLLTFHTPLDCEHPDLDVRVDSGMVHFTVIPDDGGGCDSPAIPAAVAVDLAEQVEGFTVTADLEGP